MGTTSGRDWSTGDAALASLEALTSSRSALRVLLLCRDDVFRNRCHFAFDRVGLAIRLGDQSTLWSPGPPDYDIVLLQAETHQGAVRWSRIAKRTRSTIPLIVSVSALDSTTAANVLDAGADDIIDVAISEGELVARLRAVHRRGRDSLTSGRPRRRSCGAITLDIAGRTAVVAGQDLRLRRAEYLILEHMVNSDGNLVTTRELIEIALGGRHVDGSNLIRVHLAHLRGKLGLLRGAIRTVHGAGYVLVAPEVPTQ